MMDESGKLLKHSKIMRYSSVRRLYTEKKSFPSGTLEPLADAVHTQCGLWHASNFELAWMGLRQIFWCDSEGIRDKIVLDSP